jgi:hypothetical protein
VVFGEQSISAESTGGEIFHMSEIKATHNGIEITYNEHFNRWDFELRGRERSAESLYKAKQIISKPCSEPSSKTFVRRKGYILDRWGFGEPIAVEITSVAGHKFGNQYFRLMINGARREEPAYKVIESTPETEAKLAEYKEGVEIITKKIAELNKINESIPRLKVEKTQDE